MENLNLPNFDFSIRSKNNKLEIFDAFRQKFVILTPEEWVRQNISSYLVEFKSVPISLISLEKKIVMNGMTKRFDIVVYNRQGNPLLIIECKASSVNITQDVFNQAARYNSVINAPFMIVTNGLLHNACKLNFSKKTIDFLSEIPNFQEMNVD